MKGTQTIKPLAREKEIKDAGGGEWGFLKGSEAVLPLCGCPGGAGAER